jgi:Kdo2-lipid IVA lauroyltransferase/acyltransferase
MSQIVRDPTLRERLEFIGLSGAAWFVQQLPFWSLRAISRFLGAVVFTFDAHGRAVATANIEAAFGDKFTPKERRRIARQSYQTFARTMLDLCWSPNLPQADWKKFITVEGLEDSPSFHDPEQAVIYTCLHYANFEWLSQIAAYLICPWPVITQRLKNPLLGPIFDRLRASTGHNIFPQERAALRMFKHLQGGGKFAMVCDLNLDPNEGGIILNTFDGLKMCSTATHAALAIRTGARIVPVECRPQPDGTYRFIFHPEIVAQKNEDATTIAQKCWDVLEASIHEQPECWLWSYKHWRFKPFHASERYPFYSHHAKRFDKLLQSWKAR